MSLIGLASECPRCHKPQRTRELCSACSRTQPLFPGMDTGHYKGAASQRTLDFSAPPKPTPGLLPHVTQIEAVRRQLAPAPTAAYKPPSRRTYENAQREILSGLRAHGWEVNERLKIPHATFGPVRYWFKPQAIYISVNHGGGAWSFGAARSTHIGDYRTRDANAVVRELEAEAVREGKR